MTEYTKQALVIDDELEVREAFRTFGSEFVVPDFSSMSDLEKAINSQKFGLILLDGNLGNIVQEDMEDCLSEGDFIARGIKEGLFGEANISTPIVSISYVRDVINYEFLINSKFSRPDLGKPPFRKSQKESYAIRLKMLMDEYLV